MTTEQVVVNKTQWPDSMEFGTPSTGAFKVYLNAGDKDEAKVRIENMIELFQYGKKRNAEVRE